MQYKHGHSSIFNGIAKDEFEKKLTKIGNDSLGQCKCLATHNDDQTEEHICHNHGNALSVEAVKCCKKLNLDLL